MYCEAVLLVLYSSGLFFCGLVLCILGLLVVWVVDCLFSCFLCSVVVGVVC